MNEDRYAGKRSSRNVIDVIDIQRNFKGSQKRPRKSIFHNARRMIFTLGSITAFFVLGYAIASLSVPIWAKVILFIFIAILGVVPGYMVSALFH
jgi:hypothetical protein